MIGKIISAFIFLLIVANVFLTNSVVNKGRELKDLQVQKGSLESQLRELENQIAQASSLNTVREEALRMGMVAGKLYLLPPVPVALAPKH
jgi:regulatory protein YycI of two-component signal transduction system YycFG